MADRPTIDAEHPWPWLDAYTADAQRFFNGRDDDTDALLRCVLSAPATVFFGRSGLGKTSLLQAGLAAKLWERRQFPVLVRTGSLLQSGLSSGLLTGLFALARVNFISWGGADYLSEDGRSPAARLWEWLHDREVVFRDAAGQRWTPVFILDQFEEVFTLLNDAAQQTAFFDELGDLIEGRIPPEVAQQLEEHDELLDRLDPERLGARFVLSLREDYLPDLEVHADRIPRLGPNRCRLLPMSREQALEAVDRTGGALVDTVDAQRIVDFLDQRGLSSSDKTRPLTPRRQSIEPALLSLVCAGLNQHRLDCGAAALDTRSLSTLGGQLLERFYDDAFAALPESRRDTASQFVERELITADGTRRPFPERAIQEVGVSRADLATLKDRRLLRTENAEGGAQVELVHDRVAVVAAQRARLRQERSEQARLKAAAEAEEQRRKQRRSALTWFTVAVVAALSVGLIGMWQQWTHAKTAQAHAESVNGKLDSANQMLEGKLVELKAALGRVASAESDAREKAALAEQRAHEATVEAERSLKAEGRAQAAQADAETQKVKALTAARSATALRVLSDGNDMTTHNRDGGDMRGLLLTMAGHRLAQSSSAYVLSASHGALQREALRFEPMLWINDAAVPVTSVAFSPDGSRIVSGSIDNTLRLWDARSGAPIGEPLKGHARSVWSVAFSPDGSRIVSGSHDSTLRLWDARSGAPIGEPLKGHAGWVWSVAFSPDGSRIVSGSDDHTLRLWDARSGAPIGQPLQGHSYSVNSVAFSPDGSRIVSGSTDKTLRLWDARSGAPIGEPLKGHAGWVLSVAFSPDGSRIVSGSVDNTLRLWDARSGAPIGEPLKGHAGSVLSVAFSPDGSRIVSGSHDKTLRLWDARSGTPVGEPLKGHAGSVSSVAFSPDGSRIASSSSDHTLRLWDARPGSPIGKALKGHSSFVSSVAFSPDGSRIVSGSFDYALRLWGARSGSPIGEPLKGHASTVSSVAFSPDGSRIVSGSDDDTLRLWDARFGSPVGMSLKGHSSSVMSVAFSPDGSRIVSGSADATLRLWDARSGAPIGEPLKGHASGVRSVAFSPDGSRIVSGSDDDSLRLWDARFGSPIGGPLNGHAPYVAGVAFSPDGSRIASGSDDHTLRIWPVLEAWADALCAKLPRNMSHQEWRDWVSQDIDYVVQCPGKPIPDGAPASSTAASSTR